MTTRYSYIRERLRDVIRSRAVVRGSFRLSGGGTSGAYIDARKLFSGSDLALIGEAFYETLSDLEFNAIGGPAVGSIPITAAILLHRNEFDSQLSVDGFYVRPTPKAYGTGIVIEGTVRPSSRVVVVDDVVSTGASVLRAIRAVEAAGASVVRVTCLCDRGLGADEALAAYDYRPLFRAGDLDI